MIKLSKNLRFRLIKCADKLQALLAAQIAALETLRTDLQALRADLRRLSPDTGTDLVPEWEDAAGVFGAAGHALGLLAGVAAGEDWPTVGELGMCGLLRLNESGRAVGLTEDELVAWLDATGSRLGAVAAGLRERSRPADLTGPVDMLGRFTQ